jgi:cell wall-associated NlpC family hydrolase
MFLPQRAKLPAVYAPRIMRYKILVLCAFFAALMAGEARATPNTAAEYRAAAAQEALVKVGIHYRYGGSSPDQGFDCSGLVAYVFERAWGVALPRSTSQQRSLGHPVKLANLQPGDLVFYNTRNRPYSHVGIYLGDGIFVHAPRRGQRVRLENVDNPYWRARFSGARRLDPPSL